MDIESRLAALENWRMYTEEPDRWLQKTVAALKINGVVSIRAQFGETYYESDPCIHVRIVTLDGQSDNRIEIQHKIIEALAPLGTPVRCNLRTVTENEKLKDSKWGWPWN